MKNAKLNNIVLGLVQEYGLAAIVKSCAVSAARIAQFEADSGKMGSESRRKAWEADEKTLDRVLPLIVNEEP